MSKLIDLLKCREVYEDSAGDLKYIVSVDGKFFAVQRGSTDEPESTKFWFNSSISDFTSRWKRVEFDSLDEMEERLDSDDIYGKIVKSLEVFKEFVASESLTIDPFATYVGDGTSENDDAIRMVFKGKSENQLLIAKWFTDSPGDLMTVKISRDAKLQDVAKHWNMDLSHIDNLPYSQQDELDDIVSLFNRVISQAGSEEKSATPDHGEDYGF